MTKNGTTEEERRLTEIFRAMGAKDPEGCASSHVNEGFAQLARFCFLKQAWTHVRDDADTDWAHRVAGTAADPDGPLGGLAPALKRILDKGADPADVLEVVRVMQYELLFGLLYQLGCPELDFLPEGAGHIDWALFQTNEQGEPIAPLHGLHESVLSMDPTGREMRPKARNQP